MSLWLKTLVFLVGAGLLSTAALAEQPAGQAAGTKKEATKLIATVETEKGTFTFEMLPDLAPKTVASFRALADKGFYNGLTFHRVVPGFVVQGGDPQGDGTGGPGYTLPAEFSSRKHLDGTVAMARGKDPNSAGSQFYVCLGPQPHLDGNYTVFGQVISGLDVVHKLAQGDKMLKVTVQETGGGK
jgi:peptidyl-prolyl cis-trans isomerase B (cyclophilin B)